jgi:hypothetical protein
MTHAHVVAARNTRNAAVRTDNLNTLNKNALETQGESRKTILQNRGGSPGNQFTQKHQIPPNIKHSGKRHISLRIDDPTVNHGYGRYTFVGCGGYMEAGFAVNTLLFTGGRKDDECSNQISDRRKFGSTDNLSVKKGQ